MTRSIGSEATTTYFNTRKTNRWIQHHFEKRECSKFISTKRDPNKCGCGRLRSLHHPLSILPDDPNAEHEQWTVEKHTRKVPTDAFGTIEFLGGQHPYKAQYLRLTSDTDPEVIMKLFTKAWKIAPPKLIITIHGGVMDFELPQKLAQAFQSGLIKAAKTTNAWILTSGANSGTVKYVASALEPMIATSRSQSKIVSIGILPWGILKGREEFIGTGKNVSYHPYSIRDEHGVCILNHRHSFFLFVDNGTIGKTGADVSLRRKLEAFIAEKQKIPGRISKTVPVVCVLLEGGITTINTVYNYVTIPPKVPVVICDGSGRAADLLAYLYDISEDGEIRPDLYSPLVNVIRKTFSCRETQAYKLIDDLLEIVKDETLVTLYRLGIEQHNDIDYAILSAIIKGQQLSIEDSLLLTQSWGRPDIARRDIFITDAIWSFEMLETAMMNALVEEQVDFVKLLLEKGINMQKFLTIERLEELYNSEIGPHNTLEFIVRDVATVNEEYRYNLRDIGLVIEKLMAHGYSSFYSSSEFKHAYKKLKNPNNSPTSGKGVQFDDAKLENGKPADDPPKEEDKQLFSFTYPFTDLLIWAVLTNRMDMALCMWKHGEEALAKALFSARIYKAMAQEAKEDNLSPEIVNGYEENSEKFHDLALDILDQTHKHDEFQSIMLLTYELEHFGHETCLSLAMMANHKQLMAHSCCQMLMTDLWHGGLKLSRNPNLKVFMALLFPPFVLAIDYKTKEELMLQPQTAKENKEKVMNLGEAKDDVISLDDNLTDVDETEANKMASKYLKFWKSGVQNKPIPEEGRLINPKEVKEAINRPKLPKSKIQIPKVNNEISMMEKSGPRIVKEPEEPELVDQIDLTEIPWYHKFREFSKAPISTFWVWFLSYIVFFVLLSYKLLVKMPKDPDWIEWYLFLYVVNAGIELVLRHMLLAFFSLFGMKIFYQNFWGSITLIGAFLFTLGFGIRIFFVPEYFSINLVRVIWAVSSIFWSIKLLDYCSVHQKFGPYVTIAAKMMISAKYIMGLLLIALIAFGLPKQAITYANEEFDLMLVRNIFYKPYFMLYGEVYTDDLDTCDDKIWESHIETGIPLSHINHTLLDGCYYGHYVPTILQGSFMLISNLLLINMLIAVFNDTFSETTKMATEIWHYQRYFQVVGYEYTPFWPPPFTLAYYGFMIFSLIALFVIAVLRYFFCQVLCHVFCCKKDTPTVMVNGKEKEEKEEEKKNNDKMALKLQLEPEQLESLHDFEEECMEMLLREQEKLAKESSEERIRLTAERTDVMLVEVENTGNEQRYMRTDIMEMRERVARNETKLDDIIDCLSKIGQDLEHLKMVMKSPRTPKIMPAMAKKIEEEEDKIVEELKNLSNITPRSEESLGPMGVQMFDLPRPSTSDAAIARRRVSRPNVLRFESLVEQREKIRTPQSPVQDLPVRRRKRNTQSISDIILGQNRRQTKRTSSKPKLQPIPHSSKDGYGTPTEEESDDDAFRPDTDRLQVKSYGVDSEDIRHIDATYRED